jgi:ribosomal protein S18 acetylase RimI-like enzyme
VLHADSLAFQAAVEIDHSEGGIRPARLDDLPSLLELERHFPTDRLSRRSLRRLILQTQAGLFVYEENGVAIGDIVVLYRRNSTRARLYSLIVHPACQGRGIATALLSAAERSATQRGCDVLSLEVRDDNAAALRLYQKMGYTVIARVENYYDDQSPALRLEKEVGRSCAFFASLPAALERPGCTSCTPVR